MSENDEYVATLLAKIRDLEDENKKLIKLRDVVRLILLNKGHRAFSPYMAIEKLADTCRDFR